MIRLPYIWTLPFGHFLIDVAAVSLWVYRGVEATWEWSFIDTVSKAPEFRFLLSGNLLAGLASSVLRPRARLSAGGGVLDLWWLLIHECLSFTVWAVIASYIKDKRSPRITANGYLLLRGGLLGMLLLLPLASLPAGAELLFWFAVAALVAYRLIGQSLRPLFR